MTMIYFFITLVDYSLYGQGDNEEIVFTRSTNTSSLNIILESINRTALDTEEDGTEPFRIAFIDPKKNILQRHIDFDFMILKEDRVIFRLSNMSGQPFIPIHSSRGWEIVPVTLEDFTKSGEYIFKIVVHGISFNPITPEIAEFSIQY
jgi:hypothetical protein